MDINDNGQIVVYGIVGDNTHAILLTPTTDNDTDDIDGICNWESGIASQGGAINMYN
jgi:hypothetical protein